MRLIGELNRSFGNFLTLRGIAKMGDLEEISKADEAYQRDLYSQHGDAMIAFLQAGEYTFYPELVLSMTLDETGDKQEAVNRVYESVPQKSFNQKFDGFTLKGTTKKISPSGDLRTPTSFSRGILEIAVSINEKKLLTRIDGNHRLNATQAADQENQLVPYCIIFLRNKEEAEKTNRILFTNINYKHLPLTHEENYRLILDKYDGDQYLYTDRELEDPVWFGSYFVSVRKALNELSLNNLPNIQSILQEDGKHFYTRTVLVEFFKLLPRRTTSKKDLEIAFQEIEQCYKTYPQEKISRNYQLLVIHLYFWHDKKLNLFSNWVLENHLYELESVDINGLIKIFKKVLVSKNRTIFLAMDFSEITKQNHDAIQNAIDDINSVVPKDLKLELLRIDKNEQGHSFTITDKILKQIEQGGYLIADLTLGNKNVYYEIGYQMGLNQGKGFNQDNFLFVHNEGLAGATFNNDVGFNISNISIVKASDSNNMREEVKKQIKIHYGFNHG